MLLKLLKEALIFKLFFNITVNDIYQKILQLKPQLIYLTFYFPIQNR